MADPQDRGKRTWARRLDTLPFVGAKVRRYIAAHHWARVDLTLPRAEAEIATAALSRRGWRRMALVDHEPAVLVFSVRVSSGDRSATTLLACELTVALADAGVPGPFWYSVDATLPVYEPLPEWHAAPRPPGPATQGRGADATAVRTFAARPDPSAARPVGGKGEPTDGMELVGTLSERVGQGAARLAIAWSEAPGWFASSGLAAVVLLGAFLITQMRWPATSTPSRLQEFLWWRDHPLALVLTASAGVAVAARVVARREGQRYTGVARAVALLAAAAAVGMGAGGIARLERSWAAAGGAGVLFVVGWAWRRAGYVRRRLPIDLLRLASLAGFVGLVGLYGRARAWSYYASMGVRPSAVDVPTLDAVVLGARPLALALVTAGLFLAVAWFVSGHMPLFPGPTITLIALAAAASILAGQLGIDRVSGRAVAAGRARPSAQHVGFDPGPTPVCVEWISPELAQAMPGPLPRLIWQIGTAGPDALLLDPEVARTTYGDGTPDPSAPRAQLRHGDVDAPVWYVPAVQFRRRQPVDGRCGP